ncbi:hypothetical protein GXM_00492 [Nostoc sphaeroides CCNUC1]|uniref:Uncharacterized protein n=1 Tax=Nostoc sphaeroides CCNUC1 TaxID=2653204 RepID=A0A5P8VSY3_9NOSO|nr:hypothetical protein GXM_00492 [Nostoc sphaeroides CCNUC1]
MGQKYLQSLRAFAQRLVEKRSNPSPCDCFIPLRSIRNDQLFLDGTEQLNLFMDR